ncbi:tRNA (guanine-N(7)-)-methyltransferase (tRNA(m7G46)-methyltransferase) [Coemansia sp. RSA 720]|nr:tRNA (guanine-N(7)-)-methyltransferase (tRNA(m7G46)-methyltransferase) [Coemansia sp. RSA 720]
MYSAVVAAARLLLGYALLAPLVVGALVATLLGTNIAASYWFQRRQRQRRQLGAFGPNTHRVHKRELTVDPRVPQIPRLQFASQLPRAITSSLFPTDFNRSVDEPTLELEQMGFPLVAAELLTVLKLVVRDFVQSWFGDITADTSFPRCVLAQMVQAVDAVAERMSGKIDAAQIVVGQVLPIVTAHIHAIKECEAAVLEDTAMVGDSAKQKICDMYAASPSIRWHTALHGMESGASAEERKRRVMAHVRKVVDLVVPLVLAPEQSSFAPHRVLVRELLTGALLGPVVLSIADPDTVNQLLDSQLERLIREQHMVNELRDALDQQARGDTPVPNDVPDDGRMGRKSNESTLDSETSERPVVRTYEQFMTTIDECADVEELARIHEDVLAQIRKRRILIMGQNKDDIVHGQRVRDVLVYINRLYVAKKKAERRMEMLGRDQALSAGATARRRGSSGASGSFLQGLGMSAGPTSLMRGSVSSLPEPRTLHAQPPSTVHPNVSARRVSSGRTVSGGSDPLAVPRRLRKSTVSRASTYYQHRDDPAKLGPPQFTQREILSNVTSLSAFTEYMDVIGCKFILEFWVNVEGVRQASKPQKIFPSIVRTLWKNYFTLRVDELASVGGDEVEAAISRVQRVLKPYRVAGALDLDTTKLDESVCREAFELICLVQTAVFRHMETSMLGPFLRSAFYSQFLKEYYVTPRQDQIEAALFEPVMQSVGEASETDMISETVDTVSEGAGRTKRRVSETMGTNRRGSVSRRWNFSVRGRHDEPVVGTSTAPALASTSRTLLAGLSQGGDSPMTFDSPMAFDSPTTQTFNSPTTQIFNSPTTFNSPMTQTFDSPATLNSEGLIRRVGRSEVRRLSASLRSIALGDLDQALEAAEPPSPVGEEDEDNAEYDESQDAENTASSGSEDEDEAESLVLARVIKTPTPGDLFLDERQLQLAQDLERKTHQMAIVRALMRQARSRHREHEQRVLRASFRGLRREVHAEMEQQRQYECALADHVLAPHRTRVHIPRAITAEPTRDEADAEARSHVVYLIELQQSLPTTYEGSRAGHAPTGWVVGRRYREFFAMHRELKSVYPHEMRLHELPARTPLQRLQKDRDIEHRRSGLEKYIQGLLRDPVVCNSRPMRMFLSSTEPPSVSQNDDTESAKTQRPAAWMEQIFKTVGEDIEGITGADSMLEIIVQELGTQVAMQQQQQVPDTSASLFIDPLSDLFIELFGLKNRRNWLRRQAISILLRHIFGGTVERRVRLSVDSFVDDTRLSALLGGLRSTLWPQVMREPEKFRGFGVRTDEQRHETGVRARDQMVWFVPRVLGSMVGRKNARDGARLVFDSVQLTAPSLNLALLMFDAVVTAVFPELKYHM